MKYPKLAAIFIFVRQGTWRMYRRLGVQNICERLSKACVLVRSVRLATARYHCGTSAFRVVLQSSTTELILR